LIANAELLITDLDRDDDRYTLYTSLQRYEIISWQGDVIVARSTDVCKTRILTLNSNSNEVSEFITNNETLECRERRETHLGSLISPQLEKPRIARLVPGRERTQEFWDKRQEGTSAYLNPRVGEEIKRALERTEPLERRLLSDEELMEEIEQGMGAAEPRGLPGPAMGPSDWAQPTLEELTPLERGRRELQAPVDKRNK
jgi:hypothetical protein